MSVLSSEVALKEYLMSTDTLFRELVSEHHQYEERLSELASLSYPSQDEMMEEAMLKKKKLHLKDQMEEIVTKYKSTHDGH